METIQEKEQEEKQAEPTEEKTKQEKDEYLSLLLSRNSSLLESVSNPTASIGHRNVSHRRAQSTTLFSILDSPTNMRHRVRSLSLAEAPSLDRYYPGSHLLDSGNSLVDSTNGNCPLFLSLWLLPPMPLRQQLAKEIAKLTMRYSSQGSSAPFMPHVTIIGSIACDTLREAKKLGQEFQQGLRGSGGVPCRFDNTKSCLAMYRKDDDNNNNGDGGGDDKNNSKNSNSQHLVWSQSCIATMERSAEFMNLLDRSRHILKLPPGEWMFPGPICEPHFSMFYGDQQIPPHIGIGAPPNFIATEAALFMTTPGTLQGVAKWREITRISLLS